MGDSSITVEGDWDKHGNARYTLIGVKTIDANHAKVLAELPSFWAELTRLRAEKGDLVAALEMVRDFPREGYSRRTKDGYPDEISYDEFAYKRLVDGYRDFARDALSKLEGK